MFVAESIIKYDAPRGEIRQPDIDLDDVSYDGILDGNYMKGGLGQLIDGLYGDDDYQKQLQGENSGTNLFHLFTNKVFSYEKVSKPFQIQR